MRFTRKLPGILAAAALTAAAVTSAAVSAGPAHASSGINGVCLNGTSTCARLNNSAVYGWARDISGDQWQQMQTSYQGKVGCNGSTCWPFTTGSGLNSTYSGYAVDKIYNIHNGACWAAESPSVATVFYDSCAANGTLWVWNGTVGSAYIVNVYQSNVHRQSRLLTSNGNGQPLTATVSFQKWGLINVG